MPAEQLRGESITASRLTATGSTGLGTLLLGFLSTVAYNLPPIAKVMLTCFLRNARALGFYRRRGFDTDANSPPLGRRILRGGKAHAPDYVILSKPVARAREPPLPAGDAELGSQP